MTVKFQCDGAVQIRNFGTQSNPDYKVACDCSDIYSAKSITASLPHYGYSKFVCDPENPPEEDEENPVRYLVYKVACQGTSGCGEYTKNGELEFSNIIDPLTGLVCTTGDRNTQCWCSLLFAEVTECSETSKTYDCGELTTAEKTELCCSENATDSPLNPQNSCADSARKTQAHSISSTYSLNDVVGNVDTLLSGQGFEQMPNNAGGTVITGTGHSILTWSQKTCGWEASYSKDGGVISKTKVEIIFKNAGEYTLTTTFKNGGTSEQTGTASAGQILVIDPPIDPGTIKFTPNCRPKVFGVVLDTKISGEFTTRRQVCRNEEEEEIPCPACSLFVGPDCELYNTITETASGSKTANENSQGEPSPIFTSYGSSFSGNYSYEYKQTACPSTFTCIEHSGSSSSTRYRDDEGTTVTCNCETNPCPSGPLEGSVCNGTYNGEPAQNCESLVDTQVYGYAPLTALLGSHVSCNSSTSTSDSGSYDDPYACLTGGFEETINQEQSIEVSGSEVSSSYSLSKTYSSNENYKVEDESDPCTEGSVSTTRSENHNSTRITVYSNSDDINSEAGKWESETLPWCSDDQTENCVNFTGCVERYKRATYSTDSTASISVDGEFDIPPSPESNINWKAWFHYYTVSNDFSSLCQVRTVRAFNEQFSGTSNGGRANFSASVSLAPDGDNSTMCLGGMSATAFSTGETSNE
jgi:hypothetical protein